MEREGLAQPLIDFVASGKPVLGTCAGMIMLDRDHLGVLDIEVRRNAFGRQLASFETELSFEGAPLARGVHPGPLGGEGRATAWRCSRRSTGTRSRSARATSSPWPSTRS